MASIDYSKFKVSVSEEGEITNLNELINYLNDVSLDDELETFLTTLKNKLNNSSFTNKEVLCNLIEAKLLEYNNKKSHEKLTNIEALKSMKEYNENLENLNIVMYKGHELLVYSSDFSNVNVIKLTDPTILSDIVKDNATIITGLNSKEAFNFFSNKLNSVVIFKKVLDENDPSYKLVNNYKTKFNIDGLIEIGNINGEIIYRLNDGLFGYCEKDNLMHLSVIKKPTINLEKTNDPFKEIKTATKEIKHNDNLSKNLFEYTVELVQKRDIYGINLSQEETDTINNTLNILIDGMIRQTFKNEIDFEDEFLNDYMKNLLPSYLDIINNRTPKKGLSSDEFMLCKKYLENEKYINDFGLRNTGKRLEIQNTSSRSGIVTVIILLELIFISLIILSF